MTLTPDPPCPPPAPATQLDVLVNAGDLLLDEVEAVSRRIDRMIRRAMQSDPSSAEAEHKGKRD